MSPSNAFSHRLPDIGASGGAVPPPLFGASSGSSGAEAGSMGSAHGGGGAYGGRDVGLGGLPSAVPGSKLLGSSAAPSALSQHTMQLRKFNIQKKKAVLSLQRQQMANAMRLALAKRGAHPVIHAHQYPGGGGDGAMGNAMNQQRQRQQQQQDRALEREDSFAESAKAEQERLEAERLEKERRKKAKLRKAKKAEKKKKMPRKGDTKNWLADFLKQEGIEKLADEMPGTDAQHIANKSKYLNRQDSDDPDETEDSRLEALRKAKESSHTRQDVLDMIKLINACKFLPRPKYRKEELAILRRKHPDVNPRDLILPPKPTFRGIANCVRAMHRIKVTYVVSNFSKAIALRSRSSRNLFDLMKLYFDVTRAWLAGRVSVPIKSISQHRELDFSVPGLLPGGRKPILSKKQQQSVDRRMLQVKIHARRVLASVEDVVLQGEVPTPILDFLVQLTKPGMHMPRNFFFLSEEYNLRFTVFGATKKMNQWMVKRILLNFFLTRIVIPWCILQPWTCGLATAGLQKSKRGMLNLQVLASIVYMVVRGAYSLLVRDLPIELSKEKFTTLPKGGTPLNDEVFRPPPNLTRGTLGETRVVVKLAQQAEEEKWKRQKDRNLDEPPKSEFRKKKTKKAKGKHAREAAAFSHEELVMGEKYLHEEEIAAQLLPPSYFETVYDQYFGEWMENEVNNVAVWIDTLFKQVVYRRNEQDGKLGAANESSSEANAKTASEAAAAARGGGDDDDDAAAAFINVMDEAAEALSPKSTNSARLSPTHSLRASSASNPLRRSDSRGMADTRTPKRRGLVRQHSANKG
eukprot:INCI13417.3.p1 GENE.INCI13417.3~~INCI13417.3.p1  ORF type:complete len:804 (-),score=183.12 INCI13417.3:107-2518(-)